MARIARLDGRQQALDAATRLFYEQGHESVSVETVAQAAGLTKKALYYHFPTKTVLVIATLEAAQGPVHAQLCRMARPTRASSRSNSACCSTRSSRPAISTTPTI